MLIPTLKRYDAKWRAMRQQAPVCCPQCGTRLHREEGQATSCYCGWRDLAEEEHIAEVNAYAIERGTPFWHRSSNAGLRTMVVLAAAVGAGVSFSGFRGT